MTIPSPEPPEESIEPSTLVTVRRVVDPSIVEIGVTVSPDAAVRDLVAALAAVPAGATFVESFGDVDVTLVFRDPPADA
jgi:uncharacterized repeat protein (TIGR03917 family)